ncbi:uncharacterized protein TNCV_1257821 [Trichonephila clavipes]|nr:uncharacterized protein TNCV_1257821 [Trichonephila clavipes]
MQPLEEAEKNGWMEADFSVMMVVVHLWPQQINCWNHADWGRIVFSEESRFQHSPEDNRRRAWRRPGRRACPAFIIARNISP